MRWGDINDLCMHINFQHYEDGGGTRALSGE